jgi:hypothetical protein
MSDGFDDYMTEMVDPTVAEFEAEPTNRRRAFLACVATYHGIDYLVSPGNPAALREQFRRESDAFALIDRVAHALKHTAAGHSLTPNNQPLSVGNVIPRPPAFFGIAVLDLSRWDDPVGGVTIDGDRKIDLLLATKEAVAFLRKQAAARSP